jgi:hypothetical protein
VVIILDVESVSEGDLSIAIAVSAGRMDDGDEHAISLAALCRITSRHGNPVVTIREVSCVP